MRKINDGTIIEETGMLLEHLVSLKENPKQLFLLVLDTQAGHSSRYRTYTYSNTPPEMGVPTDQAVAAFNEAYEAVSGIDSICLIGQLLDKEIVPVIHNLVNIILANPEKAKEYLHVGLKLAKAVDPDLHVIRVNYDPAIWHPDSMGIRMFHFDGSANPMTGWSEKLKS